METELRQIREGLHPTFKVEQRKLEERRQRQKEEVREYREMRIRLAHEEFDREKKAAEEEYKAEEETLQQRYLNEFEERRRRTDEGRYDGNLSQMRAAAIRKMRTRSNVETTPGGAQASTGKKREKLNWTAVQFGLKPAEIHEDFEELQRSYQWSLRQEEVAAAEDAQPAKKPRVPEPGKTQPRKAGARPKAPDIDLKGKAITEVNGARITVWYEENTPRGKQDVPYIGTVVGHKKDGITVRFDGSPDDEEELITNDDEWLWGEHKKKPSQVPAPVAAR